jgi:DNA modification methylase
MELGTHAEFLGVMTRPEMLATYFCHDGGETQVWRLKGHAEKDFWKWVASWGVACRKPSDLGFNDDGYNLPSLHIIDHAVEDEGFDKGLTLFGAIATGLNDQRAARRSSIVQRVSECAQVVNSLPDEPWIVWCGLNDEGDMLTDMIDGAVQVSGSDSAEVKEQVMRDFTSGRVRVLVSKPSICGFGMNWQHCANMAFVGVDHSYESFYQAVRRAWRFGQKREVSAHVFYATTEGDVVRNLRRKEEDAAKLSREMVSAMSEFNIVNTDNARKRDDYTREIGNGDNWTLHRGDCVDVLKEIPADSMHYSIFSPPFASLYTYSNSEKDMGNCRTDEEFATHFAFLIEELFRVIVPGRLVSFHCMNLPTSKERDGYIGIRDFRGMLIKMFEKAGFIFHSEVVIWKDPVTAMQRTKALGLLHKTIRKDSSMSRQGIPDYLVTMRKPGDNPEPISHTAEEFPVSVWQRYASPVWMDINPSKTLQYASAREEKDERHICPLQLQVIERGIELWTNPGDTVLSPFTGIGSEGYVSVKMRRKFVGAELKKSYFEQACRNLHDAEVESGQISMTDLLGDAQ